MTDSPIEMLPQRYDGSAPVDLFAPWPGNPRLHDADRIRESIGENGFAGAIIAQETQHEDRHWIIAGHGRLNDVIGAGASTVPTIFVDCDDDTGARLLIALNATEDKASYDTVAQSAFLEGLAATPTGLVGTAMTDAELNDLLDRNAAAEVRAHTRELDPELDLPKVEAAVTEPGDLWQLGTHRLVCGSATDLAAYEHLLANTQIDLILTDPPYGVGVGEKNRTLDDFDRAGQALDDLAGDDNASEAAALLGAAADIWTVSVLRPGIPWYIFAPPGPDLRTSMNVCASHRIPARHTLTWAKNRASFSLGRLDYDYQHETILYGWLPGAAHAWHANEPRTTLLTYDRPAASPDHPTMKPVPLLRELILNSTPRDAHILDPFGGSGSTLIAAEHDHRTAHLIELNPHYCDVICARYQQLTNTTPVRNGTEHSFQ